MVYMINFRLASYFLFPFLFVVDQVREIMRKETLFKIQRPLLLSTAARFWGGLGLYLFELEAHIRMTYGMIS